VSKSISRIIVRVLKHEVAGALFVTSLGILIALGPRYLFRVCAHGEDGFPICHWTARAEIGAGALIAALGLALILYREEGPRQTLLIAAFFAGLLSLGIPHVLIGGCGMMSMQCRRVAFPWLSVISLTLLVYCSTAAAFIEWRRERG
jgi:hypothetical protein